MQDRWFTDRRVGERFPYYTRGNAADVLADPVSPLGWTFLWEGAITRGARDGFIVFGLVDWDEFETPDDPECFGLFGGYFYNPLSIVRLMGARLPGASPDQIDRAYFDPNPEIPPYVAEPWHESERHAGKLAESLGWVMTTDALREVDEEKVLADRLREDRPDLAAAGRRSSAGPGPVAAALPAADVRDVDLGVARRVRRARCARRHHRRAGRSDTHHPPPGWHRGGLGQAHVRHVGPLTPRAGLGGADRAVRCRQRRPAGRLAASTSADGIAFNEAFARFKHDFGSRGPNEWDLRCRSWETHPKMALAAIDRMRAADDSASPTTRHDEAVADRERAAAEVRERLAGGGDEAAEALGTFEAAMRSSGRVPARP